MRAIKEPQASARADSPISVCSHGGTLTLLLCAFALLLPHNAALAKGPSGPEIEANGPTPTTMPAPQEMATPADQPSTVPAPAITDSPATQAPPPAIGPSAQPLDTPQPPMPTTQPGDSSTPPAPATEPAQPVPSPTPVEPSVTPQPPEPSVPSAPESPTPSTSPESATAPAIPEPFVVPPPPPAPTPLEPYAAPTTRPAATQPQTELVRPNIILITTSQQAAGMTGFEGNTQVKTPSLDALAGESAYFSRFYVPTPQDCPSRGTMLSGLYPHSHGATQENDTLIPGTVTFTGPMQRGGYRCAVAGYWPLSVEPGKAGFGLSDYVAITGNSWSWDNSEVFVQGKAAKADKHLTEWVADRAVEFLQQPHEKPFFLWVSFHAPHEPLQYPPGTEELYPPNQLEVPPVVQTPVPGRPRILEQQPAVAEYRRAKPDSLQKLRSQYLTMLTRTDEHIGRVLKQIDQQNLRDNTVVIFTSTHGRSLGEHQILGTGPFFYDELIRMPLLVRTPRYDSAGVKIDRVVSAAGLAPTVCQLAGVPMIAVHGESFLPLLSNPDDPGHTDEAFVEYIRNGSSELPVRGVISPQYKFIKYLTATEMLFSVPEDPEESVNLLDPDQKEYTPVRKVLGERLKVWQKQTNDPKATR